MQFINLLNGLKVPLIDAADIEAVLAFGSTDPRVSVVNELAACTGDSPDTVAFKLDEVVNQDRLWKQRKATLATLSPSSQCHPDPSEQWLYIQVSQPIRMPRYRFRTLQYSMSILKAFPEVKTILDYGAGGGRDSICFAAQGYDVTYGEVGDQIAMNGSSVRKRFDVRGLNVRQSILHQLPDAQRYDVINCMDVLEHVYDLEYVVADILARLRHDGLLFVWGDFFNVSYNGDHLEKNRIYSHDRLFDRMMDRAGMRLLFNDQSTFQCWQKCAPSGAAVASIVSERLDTSRLLYEFTRQAVRQYLLQHYAALVFYFPIEAAVHEILSRPATSRIAAVFAWLANYRQCRQSFSSFTEAARSVEDRLRARFGDRGARYCARNYQTIDKTGDFIAVYRIVSDRLRRLDLVLE